MKDVAVKAVAVKKSGKYQIEKKEKRKVYPGTPEQKKTQETSDPI